MFMHELRVISPRFVSPVMGQCSSHERSPVFMASCDWGGFPYRNKHSHTLILGSDSPVCRGLEGSQVKLKLGEVPENTLRTLPKYSNGHLGPCNELETHSRVYLAFADMQLGQAPAPSP